ncbi:MAG: hypothetical protein M1812_003115 [Candelaria pacifica]|nr:MAG: hypothetical protein M1812_003115 [Candelaria pacifica]
MPTPLPSPSPSEIASIAAKQEEKEASSKRHRASLAREDEEKKAASQIQAVKEAQYFNATRPESRRTRSNRSSSTPDGPLRANSEARQNWRRVGQITLRAGGDDSSTDSSSSSSISNAQDPQERQRRLAAKHERKQAAKAMDLQYFLEMVDVKHRYGSNLRAYHEEWKRSSTNENFFYWLDYGEGRDVDLAMRPREQLDRERVRYLSREERQAYLVKVDGEGKLCWVKDGTRIDTTVEYRDSVKGIVPQDDSAPPFTPAGGEAASRRSSSSASSSGSASTSSNSDHESVRGDRYVNQELKDSKGVKKIKHVSAATVLNHLLRKSVKKNTWIFVADTSFRLYVGIKQSGAFQHSSFLYGARISAAGLIKIKNGQLRTLQPRSGHYRPPTSNFRRFVKNLKDEGVDMSRVSISKSYTILIGLEGYSKTRKKIKRVKGEMKGKKDKTLHPEEVARIEEEKRDKTESAQKERQTLEKIEEDQRETEKDGIGSRFMRKLHISPRPPRLHSPASPKTFAPAQGPEDAISSQGMR